MNLDTPLEKIWRLSPFQKKALAKMQIKTAGDILWYFPVRYGSLGAMRAVENLIAGEEVVLFGKINKPKSKKSFRSKIPMSTAKLEDTTGSVNLVWFNQPYIAKMFGEGSSVRVEGRVSESKKGDLYLSNPKIEKVDNLPEGIVAGESLFSNFQNGDGHNLTAVYGETRNITSNWIYHCIQRIFKAGVLEKIEDPIPKEILEKYHLPSLRTALIWIHAPKKVEAAEAARKRFAFEEIFLIQLDRQKERFLAQKEKTFKISKTKKEMAEFTSTFPFPLTGAQSRSLEAVLTDFKTGHPMSRLLEGDVGSGKTAVAASAAYAVVSTKPFDFAQDHPQTFGSLQVAYMAPTEILAEQHFESFIEYFSKYKISVGLITGSGAKKFPSKTNREKWTKISKPQLLKWTANGEIPILIGTHALIQKTVQFKNLGLIIIDEQHRFGVKQRMNLRRKSALAQRDRHDIVPHLLSMTATPIPRTLALTIFGDLDLSLLDELPPGRKPVETKIVLPHEREAVYKKMREELMAGRQAYVICPRVNDPDPDKENTINAKSVKSEVVRLQEKVFPDLKIAGITGKMTPADKEKTMKEFKDGKIEILVATSVIEVGVNVPNATVILIENAERFGLAQLHQLRGRVLRSSHKPYCFVFADLPSRSLSGGLEKSTSKTIARLKSFTIAKNGFELAEKDLEQRGAGGLSGGKQWGVSDLAMEALKNIKMVEAARTEASKLISEDFSLSKHPLLASRLSQKQERIHLE